MICIDRDRQSNRTEWWVPRESGPSRQSVSAHLKGDQPSIRATIRFGIGIIYTRIHYIYVEASSAGFYSASPIDFQLRFEPFSGLTIMSARLNGLCVL